MSQSPLHEVAVSYLLAHQGEHLIHDRPLLVGRCVTRLLELGASAEDANVVALQALGEIDARGNGAYVDANRGTSFAVFVVDPVQKSQYAFTAADLVRIGREHAALAACPATRH